MAILHTLLSIIANGIKVEFFVHYYLYNLAWMNLPLQVFSRSTGFSIRKSKLYWHIFGLYIVFLWGKDAFYIRMHSICMGKFKERD